MIWTILGTAAGILCIQGSAIPRNGRSWEAEACSARNLRNQDRYICTQDGKIQCLDGWIGDLCQVPRCGNECDPQHGYCVKPGECKCNLGYFGPSCRDCVKLPGCQNGYCRKSFECRCEEGWSGMFCSSPVCPRDCEQNNGFCAGPGKCECKRGYSGENCTECSTLPGCQNGICNKPLECICKEGWEGTFCNQPVCATNCSREFGTCFKPGECRCRLGYQGVDCQQCVVYPGCVNGDCEKPYDCNCKEGWAGHLCDVPEVQRFGFGVRGGSCQPLGAFVCMNGGQDTCNYDGNGTLVGQPQCGCRPGYTGTWCEMEKRWANEAIEPRNPGANITANGIEDQPEDVDIGITTQALPEIAAEGELDDDRLGITRDQVENESNNSTIDSNNTTIDSNNTTIDSSTSTIESSTSTIDSSTSTARPGVTSDEIDWSRRSGTATSEKDINTASDIEKEIETTVSTTSASSTEDRAETNNQNQDVSTDFGVRAIHSDVFNSGKLIENFGSEGLQSFKDY